MLLRLLTALAFFAFFFAIINVGLQTPAGLTIKSLLESVPEADKGVHFVLLTTLTFLLNASLGQRHKNLWGYNLLIGSLIIGFGITLEECSQAFIPSRHFELMDLVCNYAGIYAGGLIPGFIKFNFKQKQDTLISQG
jgi:VanZ family protein